MKEGNGGLIVLVIMVAIVLFGIFNAIVNGKLHGVEFNEPSTIVETRTEHLVFNAEGCRVFQVIIKTPNYRDVIYVAVPHPDKHGRLTTPYPRCQVTAH